MSSASLQLLIETVDKSSAEIAMIRAEMDKLAVSAAKAEKAATGFGDRMKSVGKGLTKAGGIMTAAVTVPIVGGLVASAKAAMDFESALSDVNKVTGMEAQTDEAKAFGAEILKLTRTLPLAATELASIAAAGGSLGIAKDQLVEFTTLTAKMSTAFDMSADDAGSSIAKMMNLYKVNVDGAEDLGNAINHVSNNSSATASQIVDVATRIGGMATTFGLSADEAVGLGSAFILAGGTAETAGTSINGMLQTLQTATLGNETFQQGLERTGLSAVQLESAIKDNAVGGLQLFMDKLNELNPEERSKAIAQMFGKGVDSALISKLAGDAELFAKAIGLATDETARSGSMQAEFAARSATTANQLQLLKNSFVEMGVAIGAGILPHITSITAAIAPMISGFATFAQAHPGIMQIGVAIALVAAAIGPLLIGLGALAASLGAIVGFFSAGGAAAAIFAGVVSVLSGVFSGIAAFGTVLAAIASGIIAVMTGIAAAITLPGIAIAALVAGLVAAGYAIIANWSSVRAFFSSLGASIGAAFQSISARAASAFASAAGAARSAGAAIGAGFQSAVGAVQGAISSIISVVIGGLSGLAGQARAMGSRVVSGIADGIRAGVGAIGSAMSGVAAAIAARMPGSPVKEGILKDTLNGTHNAGYRVAEMLATGLDAGSGLLGGAMGAVTQPIAATASAPVPVPATGGGTTSNSFSPNVTINVNGGGSEIAGQLDRQLEETFARLFAQYKAQQARVSYG